MPFVSVNGAAIHYGLGSPFDTARGPTLVFVHGAGGAQEQWRFQLRHLGPRWNALAVDLPGHGESQGTGCRTIGEYRDFVRDLLEALAIRRAVLRRTDYVRLAPAPILRMGTRRAALHLDLFEQPG